MTTLYKVSGAGNELQWSVKTVGNKVFVEYGQVGGKLTASSWEATGKNIGRSNETSPVAQAVLEMESAINSKLDAGYAYSIEDAKKHKFKPMKLDKLIDTDVTGKNYVVERIRKKLGPVIYVMEKFDGCWVCFSNEGGEVEIISRGLQPNIFDSYKQTNLWGTIENIVLSFPVGAKFFGELYHPNREVYDQATIAGALKRKKKFDPILNELRFGLFDYVDDERISDGWARRAKFVTANIESHNMIDAFPFEIIENTPENVMEIAQNYQDSGREGAVGYSKNAKYQFGRRSKEVVKMKLWDTDDYEVLDIICGPRGNILAQLVTDNGKKI